MKLTLQPSQLIKVCNVRFRLYYKPKFDIVVI